ncbi:MAG: hypothetical protein ACREN8_11135 [Candidatus Dormibacteraceae bacterium]
MGQGKGEIGYWIIVPIAAIAYGVEEIGGQLEDVLLSGPTWVPPIILVGVISGLLVGLRLSDFIPKKPGDRPAAENTKKTKEKKENDDLGKDGPDDSGPSV